MIPRTAHTVIGVHFRAPHTTHKFDAALLLPGELLAVVGMCNETNRLAQAYDVPVDPMFLNAPAAPSGTEPTSAGKGDVSTMYHNKTFRAVTNDPSGEVGDATRFHYKQDGGIVHAT